MRFLTESDVFKFLRCSVDGLNDPEAEIKPGHCERSCAVFKVFISFIFCYALDSRLGNIVASKKISGTEFSLQISSTSRTFFKE